MFEHSARYDDAFTFSRFDTRHLLSTVSLHGFDLEDLHWPTAEHYYQSRLYTGEFAETIRRAGDGHKAFELGKSWFRPKRNGWKKLRQVLMTRALYCKAKAHPEVANYLLATGDKLIAETSLYDHYWGIGRDQRGENTLGKVWMNVRKKLREEREGGGEKRSGGKDK